MKTRNYITYFIKNINIQRWILVAIVGFIVSTLSILHVIIGFAKTVPGMVYMWTGHFYLDYFYYLLPIAQGKKGYWIAFQQFATDDTSKYFHLTPYILIGKLAWLLNLSPIVSYWLSVFLFVFVFVIVLYTAIVSILKTESFLVKLITLLVTIFTTPFFTVRQSQGQLQMILFDFWSSFSTFFRRFEPVPHHLLGSILILISLLLIANVLDKIHTLSSRKFFFASLYVGLLLSGIAVFSPFSVIVVLVSLTFVFFGLAPFLLKIKKRGVLKNIVVFYITVCVLTIGSGIILKSLYSSTFAAQFKAAETSYHQQVTIKNLFFNLGPILLVIPFGVKRFFKHIHMFSFLLGLFTLSSYLLFISPVDLLLGTHNARFLSPINSLFFACLAVLGVREISVFFKKRQKRIFIGLSILLLLSFIPVNTDSFLTILKDKYIFSPTSYLPKGVIDGYTFLAKVKSDKAVLTTPSQFLGQMVPAFTGKSVYIARLYATPDYPNKAGAANWFYLGMDEKTAKTFLKKNDIGFVMLTSIEGYPLSTLFNYSFLQEMYRNRDSIIFKVKSI